MVFGHRKPEPIPVVVKAPKIVAEELLLLIGLGLFCLLAVLFIGQVARVLGFIGGKLVNAMSPPVPEHSAERRKQQSTAASNTTTTTTSSSSNDLPADKAPWPYYKQGMPPLATGAGSSPTRGGSHGPTGAGASSTASCRSDCSDACCSPPGRKTSPLHLGASSSSFSGEQEEALTRHFKERSIKLVGYLLDDMFERDPYKGSTLVNSIPSGLRHQCFMAELHRRMVEAEAHGMAHAAENPMAIKRANDDTFEAQIDQARKGLTPRRAKRVTDALALKKEKQQGPNYPRASRFRPPDVKERTKWWWYYQLKSAEAGKYHQFLMAAFETEDGFPVDALPGAECSCCLKPNQQKPFTLKADRNEALPRVFGPQEYTRPNIRA